MLTLRLSLHVDAPPERCFDLSRSVDLHEVSTAQTGERAVAGTLSGLMGLHDTVTWRARHLGVWQELTSQIVAYDRPNHFRDSMVRGAFRHFDHDHLFEADPRGGTRMSEVFTFSAPLGPLGWLAERLFLGAYMQRFLERRAALIRQVAEGEQWRRYLPGEPEGPPRPS